MQIEDIARVCHEANRAYCLSLGDESQLPWNEAPQWQRDAAINGVQFHIDNPGATPAGSHFNWMTEKFEAGWVYGPVKDEEKKEHPCLVSYSELPEEQRVKDSLFLSIVKALTKRG